MMKLLDPYWWRGMDRFVSMEIRNGPDGPSYRMVDIQHRQGSLIVRETFEPDTWESVLSHLTAHSHLPILLDISGSYVMEKVLSGTAGDVFQAFGIRREQAEQFHAQHLFQDQPHPVGAMIRQDQLSTLLEAFGPQQTRIISLNLSPAIGLHLLPQILSLNSETAAYLDIRDSRYFLQNGVPSLPTDPQQAQIINYHDQASGYGIEAENLVLVAHALSYLYLDSSGVSPQIDLQAAEYRRRNNWLKSLAVSSLLAGMFLLIMLISQIWYQFEVGKLARKYQASSTTLDTIRSNRSMIIEREATVKRLVSSTLKSSQIAWILDQISIKRPPEIAFTGCWFQPNEEQLKRLDAEEQKGLDLAIRGTAQASEEISAFTLTLEQLPCIASLEIHRSGYVFRREEFEFVLFITLSPS